MNLLDTTAKVHGEKRPVTLNGSVPLWDESFYHLQHSDLWHSLAEDKQNQILISLGQKILQEAYFIECAGMAYAAKMNLAARTLEERAFFCFVGEEEAKHLRLVESLDHFNTSLETIPSFALLIGEIIQDADRPSHLLLIQILLEGWGLHYYKSLAKSTKVESVAQVFKGILKDEIRHHSGGVLLFNAYKNTHMSEQDIKQFLEYLERIAFMVKVGPWIVTEEMMKQQTAPTIEMLKTFLSQTQAVSVTSGKMKILQDLLKKSLPAEVMKMVDEKKTLLPLTEEEMLQIMSQSML